MVQRIAINGAGRIGGKAFLRAAFEDANVQIVAINDLGFQSASADGIASYLSKDTVHGHFKGDITVKNDDTLTINGHDVKLLSEADPAKLPWGDLGVDSVAECTGVFRSMEKASLHLKGGAGAVVVSAPVGDMKNIVYGINHDILSKEDKVISGASCTTNCTAPIAYILHKEFGIDKASMTTVHAYTSDQNILDTFGKKFGRNRAGAQNIVLTDTGAAKAVGVVIPELQGKFEGQAFRVPTPDGSVVDLKCTLKKNPSPEEVNEAISAYANNQFSEFLGQNKDKDFVSSDVLGTDKASVFDHNGTFAQDNLITVVSWYDNETSYAAQLLRTMRHQHQVLAP